MEKILNCNLKKSDDIILKLPDFIARIKGSSDVSIDREIAVAIKHLWDNDILTLSSCCGHKIKNPSVVIWDGYGQVSIEEINRLIKDVDDRDWDIFQWKLVKV